LAEKVESHEEFTQMSKLGFSYFQGYFFCRPERIKIKEVDSAKINLVNLLAEVNRKTTSLKKLEKIIRGDAGLAYKLLRFINSSYFYRINEIESVAHAITYLGTREIQRFLILVLISELATDKPAELVRMAVVRAKMGELLVRETVLKEKEDEVFLLGLFSLLDAMLDTTMDFICEHLSPGDHLKHALINPAGPYSTYLQLIIGYEKRDEARCLAATKKIGLGPGKLHQMFMDAISYAESAGVC
jgi:c-di-GMP-related signal transduction protein